ncbi:hypothetical protein [Streptomyces acidiscabies]|uniref:hypothetical protein n=1 Tax=Streptomyces acidiscabies TaxID=42234 RepID=UPI000950C749|nr:hypothetical protein [Streptomyces acidiscabies]
MNKVQLTTAKAPSTPTASAFPTVHRSDAATQARIAGAVDRIMAAIGDPTTAFQTLTAERGIQVEEWDTSTLDDPLPDAFLAHYLERKDGVRILVVPTGQNPVVRLHALLSLLDHQAVTA